MKLGKKFNKAVKMATKLHGKQTRKGSDISYMGHLLGVTAIVIDDGGSEEEIIAALLHDGPEDAGGKKTLKKIEEEFGTEVAQIVAALSDTFEKEKPEWRARKEQYFEHLRGLPDTDLTRKILRVSLADKLHNARSIAIDRITVGEEVWDRFNGKKAGSLWYYEELAGIYAQRLPRSPLVREYRMAVDRLSRGD